MFSLQGAEIKTAIIHFTKGNFLHNNVTHYEKTDHIANYFRMR